MHFISLTNKYPANNAEEKLPKQTLNENIFKISNASNLEEITNKIAKIQ